MTPPRAPARWVKKTALWRFESWLADHYSWSVVVIVLLAINEILFYRLDFRHWDWLLVSGVIIYIVTIRATFGLPEKMHETLGRLIARAALSGSGGVTFKNFERGLHESARRATIGWAFAAAAAMATAWLLAFGDAVYARWPLFLAEIGAAALAGLYIGRAITYGRLGRRLGKAGFSLKVEPGHVDGAAGLKPIGDLYFFQASLLVIPAAYLAVWWFLIPLVDTRYDRWRVPYALLLSLVLLCELLAFVAPMWSFHRAMLSSKQTLLLAADEISAKIDALEEQLVEPSNTVDRTKLRDQISELARRFLAIENMPTWPIDVRMRRRFTTRNIVLLLPVIVQLANAPDSLQQLVNRLKDAVTG